MYLDKFSLVGSSETGGLLLILLLEVLSANEPPPNNSPLLSTFLLLGNLADIKMVFSVMEPIVSSMLDVVLEKCPNSHLCFFFMYLL